MINRPVHFHPGVQPWALFLLAARATYMAAHPELAKRLRNAQQRCDTADETVFRPALREISDIAQESIDGARAILDSRKANSAGEQR
ncbi:hypothetical protein [Streptomyces sp. SGAir0957]